METACRDPRVAAVLLINPAAVPLHESSVEPDPAIWKRATARHYWRIALFSSFRMQNFFRTLRKKVDYLKVLRGMAGFSLLSPINSRKQISSTRDGFESRLILLRERGVHPSFLFAEGDEGLDYLRTVCGSRLKQWCGEQGLMKLEIITEANHTFTMLWSQEALLARVENWARLFTEIDRH